MTTGSARPSVEKGDFGSVQMKLNESLIPDRLGREIDKELQICKARSCLVNRVVSKLRNRRSISSRKIHREQEQIEGR
jgi:hypothetical protein